MSSSDTHEEYHSKQRDQELSTFNLTYDTIPTRRVRAFGMELAMDVAKLDRVNRAIEAQKRFIRTVPDPDNRERAEANLMSLVLKRDEYVDSNGAFLDYVLVK